MLGTALLCWSHNLAGNLLHSNPKEYKLWETSWTTSFYFLSVFFSPAKHLIRNRTRPSFITSPSCNSYFYTVINCIYYWNYYIVIMAGLYLIIPHHNPSCLFIINRNLISLLKVNLLLSHWVHPMNIIPQNYFDKFLIIDLFILFRC